MRKSCLLMIVVAAVYLPATLCLPATLSASSGARAHDGADRALLGTWAIDFVVPVSPKGNNFGQPHRHRFTFKDEDGQHTVEALEILDLRVPGAWRANGEEFSATFEFTCPDDVICGTIIMRGRLDSDKRMSGRVVIFWDEADSTTETGLDTVTGTFTGEKCNNRNLGLGPAHDTGGCQ